MVTGATREMLARALCKRFDDAELKLGTDRLIVCSLAVGYADEIAPVNRFVPERAPLEDYVQWHD